MTLPDIRALLYEATAFGDVELIAPAVFGLATAFWIAREKRNAMNFAGVFVLCLVAITLAKIALMVFWRGGPLRSPSGHSAISAFFYGSLALMLIASSRAWIARALAVGCGALILVITVSRFMVGGHSRTEAAVGLALGTACAFVFQRRFTRLKTPGVATAAMASLAGVAVTGALWWLLEPGYVDEETIAHFARWLRGLRSAS
jgi:membrane-associated phospholipid phosphatase